MCFLYFFSQDDFPVVHLLLEILVFGDSFLEDKMWRFWELVLPFGLGCSEGWSAHLYMGCLAFRFTFLCCSYLHLTSYNQCWQWNKQAFGVILISFFWSALWRCWENRMLGTERRNTREQTKWYLADRKSMSSIVTCHVCSTVCHRTASYPSLLPFNLKDSKALCSTIDYIDSGITWPITEMQLPPPSVWNMAALFSFSVWRVCILRKSETSESCLKLHSNTIQ